MQITFSVKLPCKFTKRKKWIVASCDILDIHSQGKNEREAKKNLVEATTLFLISCFERGTLDAVLKDCGFVPNKFFSVPLKKHTPSRMNYIDVPVPFHIKKSHAQSCRA